MANSGFLITQIKQRQDRIFTKLLEEMKLDMNGSQGRIIYVLWEVSQLTMSELSEKTSLANNTLTNMIKRMQEQKLVVCKKNPNNKRETYVSLTESTRNLKDKVDCVTEQMNELFYKGISQEEIEILDNILEKILYNLIAIEE